MNWETRKSMTRLVGVFNRNKGKVYAQDIDALKHINNILESETTEIVNDHLLFAKLLAYVFKMQVIQCGDMKMSVKRVNDVLSLPLSYHLDALRMQINESERQVYLESIGIDTRVLKDEEIILSQHQKTILAKLKAEWNDAKIRQAFHNTAEAMIKNVNNYG